MTIIGTRHPAPGTSRTCSDRAETPAPRTSPPIRQNSLRWLPLSTPQVQKSSAFRRSDLPKHSTILSSGSTGLDRATLTSTPSCSPSQCRRCRTRRPPTGQCVGPSSWSPLANMRDTHNSPYGTAGFHAFERIPAKAGSGPARAGSPKCLRASKHAAERNGNCCCEDPAHDNEKRRNPGASSCRSVQRLLAEVDDREE